jgi:hypothetical protein|tara:strand:- start:8328 stop:8600 length:273 start_codon:yes stop_codon:yes gene_type:complete
MEKLNQIKFGIAGGVTTVVSVLLIELFLWIKLIPSYNSIMISVYGVAGLSGSDIFRIMFFSVVLSFLIGFILSWVFAWIYNKLPQIKILK